MPALERLHQGNCCEIKASQDIDFASKEQGVGKMAKQVRHLCPDNELHSLSLISRTHVKVESTLLPASYIINTKKTIRKFKTEKKQERIYIQRALAIAHLSSGSETMMQDLKAGKSFFHYYANLLSSSTSGKIICITSRSLFSYLSVCKSSVNVHMQRPEGGYALPYLSQPIHLRWGVSLNQGLTFSLKVRKLQ